MALESVELVQRKSEVGTGTGTAVKPELSIQEATERLLAAGWTLIPPRSEYVLYGGAPSSNPRYANNYATAHSG